MAKTDLTNQRQVFVEEYVRSGDHLEAAKKAGYKDTHTLRNQACKLRRECADEISDELHLNDHYTIDLMDHSNSLLR